MKRILRALSYQQKIAIALCKSISATLSLIASSLLIYKIYLRYKLQSRSPVVSSSLRSSKNDGITTYHRMLLIISILDVIHSISSAFSVLLVPSYTNGVFARGTTTTCTIQGALQQLTPTIVIYLAMLNTYFMLKIRYNISDSVINRRYEVWLHAIPISHFLTTAIIGLSMGIFGPIILPELGCWLDTYCALTHTCTRSGPIFYDHFDYFAWSFAYIWLFICVVVLCINGVLIYTAIRRQERRNENYFAAKLISQSEAAFSVSHQSGSSTLRGSNAHTELVASHHVDNKSVHDQIVKQDGKSKPTKTQSVVENLELKEIDETEETGVSYEDRESAIDIRNPSNCFEDTDFHTSPSNNRRQSHIRLMQQQQTNIKQSRIAAVQSILYVSTALFTAFWIFMPWVGSKLSLGPQWRGLFAAMVNIASPSQGVFNLLLYVRIHYLRLRETNADWNRWKCVKVCLFSSD